MTKERTGTQKRWRDVAVACAVAVGAAMLGVSAAPRVAAAASPNMIEGWSCYGTDRCHAGDRACCTEYSEIGGNCSTICG